VFEGTEFVLVCVLAMLRDEMTTGRSIEEAQLERVDTGSKKSVECALILIGAAAVVRAGWGIVSLKLHFL